jgi:hypothetical protein
VAVTSKAQARADWRNLFLLAIITPPHNAGLPGPVQGIKGWAGDWV